MLTHLFGSKTRVKILKLFLLHPEEKYYIRELSRMTDVQVNSARRELNNLQQFGLLYSGDDKLLDDKKETEIKKNKEKYYQVNKKFELFNEIRALIVRAQVLYKEDFVESIKKIGEPELIVLTGLFVGVDDSIVDVLVVGSIKKKKMKKIIGDLEDKLGRDVNFTLMDLDEFEYRQQITDVFLYTVFNGEKIVPVNKLNVI